MKKSLLAASLLVLPACPKPGAGGDDGKALIGQVKSNLAQRDGAISSYRFTGETEEAGHAAVFDFQYRAPNRMKGSLKAPSEKTFSFDGEKLHELSPAGRTLTTFVLKLPKEKNALLLAQTFSPFVPEGYRAPLFDDKSVKVKKVSHPKAVEAVELRTEVKDAAGHAYAVTHTLRWPSMDFLGKTTEANGDTGEVRVDEEHCLERPKICFPKKLTQWTGGKQVAETRLENIAINGEMPVDSFQLIAPEGYEKKAQELIEAP